MKKVLSIILCLMLFLTMTAGFACAENKAEAQDLLSEAVYLMGENGVFLDNIIPGIQVTKETFSQHIDKNMIVDTAMLDAKVEKNIKDSFEKGKRIVLIGEISEEIVRSCFGVSKYVATADKKEANLNGNRVSENGDEICDVSQFPKLGILIYQENGTTNVTNLYVEDLFDESLVFKTLEYCLQHDYLKFQESKDPRGIAPQNFGYSWKNVDTNTATYTHPRCIVTTSLRLDKNSDNPNSAGEYLYYLPYEAEISMNSGFKVRKGVINTIGKPGSKVYGYGPKNESSAISVTISLPYGISTSISTKTNCNIEKTEGGLDSDHVKITYQPVTSIGIDKNVDELACFSHIEAFQDNNSYLGYGQFSFTTTSPTQGNVTITNNSWDVVQGK